MRTGLLTVLAVAALPALLLLPPPAAGAGGTYVDKNYGFSLKIGPEWSQTPTQPGEKTEVAKFKDDQKGAFATLSVLRFGAPKAAETTPAGEEDPDLPDVPDVPEPPPGWGPPQPKSAVEYLETGFKYRSERLEEEWKGLPEPKTVKFGKIEGRIYTIDFKSKRASWYDEFTMAGVVAQNGEEYLILYQCPPNRAKKLTPYFLMSIRSFRFAGDDTPEAEEDDPEDRGKVQGKAENLSDLPKRERIKKELVGTWRFIDTPRYIVIYNCDQALADYIAKRVEYMRTNAFEKVFPPVEPINECMVVRVCKEMDEYHHYGGPGGSAGYWSSGSDELVFPDLSQSKKPDIETVGVMHHEGFHQYIHYALLKHHPPIWFNEGFAEYFFCVDFKSWSEKLVFEKRHPMRYGTVKSSANDGSMVPLKDFIQMSQPQYYSRAQLCYSQGWAFATWLKNVTKNERYQQVPVILFQEMQKAYAAQAAGGPGFPGGGWDPSGRDAATKAAMEKAFEGIDLDVMHEEFLNDVKRKM